TPKAWRSDVTQAPNKYRFVLGSSRKDRTQNLRPKDQGRTQDGPLPDARLGELPNANFASQERPKESPKEHLDAQRWLSPVEPRRGAAQRALPASCEELRSLRS